MPNRRDLVKTAIGISAFPLIRGALASATVAAAGCSVRDALVDERSDASRAFGRGARIHGITIHPSRGDWSQLWLEYLDRESRLSTRHDPGRKSESINGTKR